MCNKTVDNFLPALEFVPDWFVTSKMIKTLFAALYTDDNILFDKYSGDTRFCWNQMVILSLDHNNMNLDDTNYDENDPETILYQILA